MWYGGCPCRKLAWGRPQGYADVQYAREACADWHMAMHMYYVGVCLVWMHVPPSAMATTATKDMYARPDASLLRRAQGLVAEEDEPVLWRDMWASSQTSLLARARGVSGESETRE